MTITCDNFDISFQVPIKNEFQDFLNYFKESLDFHYRMHEILLDSLMTINSLDVFYTQTLVA